MDGQPVRQRPTIHDVARHAGVSKSLVSLVLQGSTKVSDASREAVVAAMRALDYQPNRLARGLARRRSGIIGVVASDLHNPFFVDVLDAVLEFADDSGLRTLLATGRRRRDQERLLLDSLVGLPVDGILLLSPVIAADELARLARRMPITVTGRSDVASDSVDTVVNDDQTGAGLVVEHLVGLDHRRIAHITGGDAPSAAARERGFREAMAAAGLGRQLRVVRGEFTEDGGHRAMRRLLRGKDRPTAVFAGNDYAALGALNAIDEVGLRVPQDISLVGYDNSSISAFRHISLTSVDQPHSEMGRLAIRLLHERLTGTQRPTRHIVLTPKLVVRATTAPPTHTGGTARRKPIVPDQ